MRSKIYYSFEIDFNKSMLIDEYDGKAAVLTLYFVNTL